MSDAFQPSDSQLLSAAQSFSLSVCHLDNISQLFSQFVCQPASQLFQPVSLSVSYSVHRSVNQSVSELVTRPTARQSFSLSLSQSISQSVGLPLIPPVIDSVKHLHMFWTKYMHIISIEFQIALTRSSSSQMKLTQSSWLWLQNGATVKAVGQGSTNTWNNSREYWL